MPPASHPDGVFRGAVEISCNRKRDRTRRVHWLALFFASLLIAGAANSASPIAQGDGAALQSSAQKESTSETDFEHRIRAIEQRTGGRIGVAALDTGNGKRLDYRSEERFPMCSTFKLLAAAAVLKRVDEAQEKLDRLVSYGEKDILEYAPVTKAHLKDGGMTLGALCAAAIEQSDNTAGNLLLDTIGGPAQLTNFARSIGDETTRLDRKEPALNSANPGDERDTTNPAAMCANVQRLVLNNVLSKSSRHQLEEWLRHNETGTLLVRAGVPKTWIVGDKTGRCGNGATNDVAIIRPPDRAPIFLAVYSIGSTASANDRDSSVAETARAVVEFLR
jgi:beta-lactamase class A